MGLGRHEANVSPADHMSLKKAEYAFSVLYVRASVSFNSMAEADGRRILH